MQFFPFGFDDTPSEGSVELLGGKGAGLVWMCKQGIPVPPGFIISTDIWAEYDKKPKATMKAIAKALPAYLAKLEQHLGYLPLLSVRSGARKSCPGMMDTILNVGIDSTTYQYWLNALGPKCFGDSFHRLVTMYGSVVHGIRRETLEHSLKAALEVYQEKTGGDFPTAADQLLGAIEAVFKSWDNDRAHAYRKLHGYAREWGTAVTVQAMVFGNLNDQSGSGVLFTRNPDTGENTVTGEFLKNAQGEDIVAGIRTPHSLSEFDLDFSVELRQELIATAKALEVLKTDVQDIEFTVQNSKLYLLQTRDAKRSAVAALKIAVDLAKEGLIAKETAVRRVSARQFDIAQQASLDPKFDKDAAYQGIGACSGIVTGKPVFSKEDAIKSKVPCVLVTEETTPDDIAGMFAAVGVVTMKGGMTSHAAVNARAMDRACVVGVGQTVEAFKDIEVLSLDGATGRIWTEVVPIVSGQTNGVLSAYSALVCETLGVVPVVFDVPTKPVSEVLLYLGNKVLQPLEAVATVVATAKLVDRLYVDVTVSPEEEAFLNILKAADPVGTLVSHLNKALPKGSEGHGKIVLIASTKYSSSFTRLIPTTELRDIILSGNELVLDGLDTSDPAIAKVLAWKQQEGLVAVSIGAYVAGSKSMISVPQALQLIANGTGV